MSDKSPEETPEETPLDDHAGDEVMPESGADTEARSGATRDDEVIEELEKDLPADDTPRAAAPIKRKTAQAPVKKAAATRKRKDAHVEHEDPYKAKNPAHFARQSAGELKKVVWPTWPQLVKYFLAVLAFVLFIIAFVSGLDALFGWSLLQLLGSQ